MRDYLPQIGLLTHEYRIISLPTCGLMSYACFARGTHLCGNETMGAHREVKLKTKFGAFGFNLLPYKSGGRQINELWWLKSRAFIVTVRLSPEYLIKAHVFLKNAGSSRVVRRAFVSLVHLSVHLSPLEIWSHPGRPGSPPSWICLEHHPKDTSGTHLCQMSKQPNSTAQLSFFFLKTANWVY